LAYRDDRRWRDVRSADINAHLKDVLGEEHSAKDFRTWHATVLAAIDIARVTEPGGRSAVKRHVAATVRRVADHMGNTPAVCRASYIDPRVFDRFHEGLTVAPALRQVPADDEQARAAVERAVLDLIGDEVRSLAA
jgi:DNA topoisomerase IB